MQFLLLTRLLTYCILWHYCLVVCWGYEQPTFLPLWPELSALSAACCTTPLSPLTHGNKVHQRVVRRGNWHLRKDSARLVMLLQKMQKWIILLCSRRGGFMCSALFICLSVSLRVQLLGKKPPQSQGWSMGTITFPCRFGLKQRHRVLPQMEDTCNVSNVTRYQS